MATELLFETTPYAKSCEATVTAVDERGIELDRTVFYPGGGQPGDAGRIRVPGWGAIPEAGDHAPIVDTIKGHGAGTVIHVAAPDARLPEIGDAVVEVIDWPRRHRLMRMHTCMHLLSAVLPYPVTGGQIRDGTGRLDFDIPEPIIDKDEIAAKLNAFIQEAHAVGTEWITDAALAEQPELVKTMAVKPPHRPRTGAPGQDRRPRPAAVRRHPRRLDRRDRDHRGHQDPEEEPAQSPRLSGAYR